MTNFKYTLLKLSSPGFEFNTSDIKTVLHLLEMGVCDICMSFNPVEEYASNIPDNYYELDDLGKIEALLWTACGCEYSFEDNDVIRQEEYDREVGGLQLLMESGIVSEATYDEIYTVTACDRVVTPMTLKGVW